MGRTEKISSLFWMLAGIAIFLAAQTYPLGSFREPGGGLYPCLLGGLLIVLAVMLLVGSWNAEEHWPPASEWERKGLGRSTFTIGGLFIIPFLFDLLGFFPAMLLFMFFMTKVIMPLSWLTALTTSLLSTAGGYTLFEWWLKIQFPRGLFGL